MDRQSFTDLIQTKFKMVRIEAGYTQDTMAQTIGLSKKTLVQIEKREYYQTGQLVFQFVHYSETLKY
ncbi:HTH domain protein, binds to mecA promoter region [Staphylococcus aureus]|nr:HTH domain protein, binds to mecA promoter region [Staphylococcus aureus]